MNDTAAIAALEAENAALRQQVTLLQEKVALLLGLLQKQKVKKDSHNSHLPPASDMAPKKNQSLRPPSTRKSGGQPGHPGQTLQPKSPPDNVSDLKSNFCGQCGASLADAVFTLQAARQVADIPPLTPVYHEYRQFAASCPCCPNTQSADFPAGVNAPVQYGPRVTALVAYLSVYQYLPYRRLTALLSAVCGLSLSEGSVANLLRQAAEKAAPVYAGIKAELAVSRAVGADETSAQVNGEKWWVWVWQNARNTFLVAAASRAWATIQEVWSEGLPPATLVSDRYAAHLKMVTRGHQLCLAHLLRDATYLTELEGHSFAQECQEWLREVFGERRGIVAAQAALTPESGVAQGLEKRLNELLGQTLDATQHPKTAIFQRALTKQRNYLLPCLYDLEIPADNNGSERAIRNVKVKEKVSGQFKTGQEAFCVLRSVIDTLRKRELDILTYLQAIMQTQPDST